MRMKLLLAVDGSACSLRAVGHVVAIRQAWRMAPQVHLLNVHPPIPIASRPGSRSATTICSAITREEGEAQLAAAGGLRFATPVSTSFVTCMSATPVKSSRNSAHELGCDWIVVGNQGAARWLMPSSARCRGGCWKLAAARSFSSNECLKRPQFVAPICPSRHDLRSARHESRRCWRACPACRRASTRQRAGATDDRRRRNDAGTDRRRHRPRPAACPPQTIELSIEGHDLPGCATRVEKVLNRIDGSRRSTLPANAPACAMSSA